MFQDDRKLTAHLAAGGKVTETDDLSPRYRGELVRLMASFVDSALAGAAGLVEQINHAPGLSERSAAARMVSEKFDHARAVLTLMERFGVNPDLYVREHPWPARLDRDIDLGNRRVGGDKRLNVFHYPIAGWTDCAAFTMLMGEASAVQLEELCACSYAPLGRVMAGVIVTREQEHARLGLEDLTRAIERAGSTAQAQASVNYWRLRVAATFGRLDSERFDLYRQYGLRQHSNAALVQEWEQRITPALAALTLT